MTLAASRVFPATYAKDNRKRPGFWNGLLVLKGPNFIIGPVSLDSAKIGRHRTYDNAGVNGGRSGLEMEVTCGRAHEQRIAVLDVMGSAKCVVSAKVIVLDRACGVSSFSDTLREAAL
jgi:hypothetical protein